MRGGAIFDATRQPVGGERPSGSASAPSGGGAAEVTAPRQTVRRWFQRLLADLHARHATRREARALSMTARDLHALSDHSLRDIGLLRGSIEATLREHSRPSR